MPDLQEANLIEAVYPHGVGREKIWLRRLRVPVVAALLLSLAACSNQSATSPPSERLSITNNPGAIGR